ncbi:hypothetical protein Sjap_003050 [Stephania japonica]|uniref:Uncharacterized protein n=1 Tax=Stephania japonica TaxID=461633 RepID=A0AAP0KNX8_9MAGN
MAISAPTGSGKIVLFELYILRLLSRFLSQDGKFNHVKGTLKIVSPTLNVASNLKEKKDAEKESSQMGQVGARSNLVPLDSTQVHTTLGVVSTPAEGTHDITGDILDIGDLEEQNQDEECGLSTCYLIGLSE